MLKHNNTARQIIYSSLKTIESALDVLDYLDEESPTDDIQMIVTKYKEKIKAIEKGKN